MLGSPAARLPQRFRHSRYWCSGLARPPPSGPLAGRRAWGGQSAGGSVATLGRLSPSPFLWVSKVTLGSPAARLPRRFRHSRCWRLGLARPPPSGPVAGQHALHSAVHGPWDRVATEYLLAVCSLQLSLHIISTHVFLWRVIYICTYLCFLSCRLPLMASRAVLLYIRWLRATIRHPRTAVGATLITQNEGNAADAA